MQKKKKKENALVCIASLEYVDFLCVLHFAHSTCVSDTVLKIVGYFRGVLIFINFHGWLRSHKNFHQWKL